MMNLKKHLKSTSMNSLLQQMNNSDTSEFYIYFIEILGNDSKIKKPAVITKRHMFHQLKDNMLNLVYVKTDTMKNLSMIFKTVFKSRFNNPRAYIIYNISNCKNDGELQQNFKVSDFLLGDKTNPKVSKEFFTDNIYFVTKRRANQSVQYPYRKALPNCIYEFNKKSYTLWEYLGDVIQTRHPLDFPDKAILKNKHLKDIYIKALCGDGDSQFKYANTFKFNHYISHLLWSELALENGSIAALKTNYSVLAVMDFEKITVERHYIQMLENGLTQIAGKLYDIERKKSSPKKSRIEYYLNKGIENGTLTDYYNYAIHYCFVLNGSDSHDNKKALSGFQQFVRIFNNLPYDDEEKNTFRSLLKDIYYAYAVELSVMDEEQPDFDEAFKYFKKSLNENMYFADKIMSIGKEFCFGGGVKINLKHGTDILCWLAKIGYEKAKKYLPEVADELLRQKQFAAAEKCYEQCLEFDLDCIKKYILSIMCEKFF